MKKDVLRDLNVNFVMAGKSQNFISLIFKNLNVNKKIVKIFRFVVLNIKIIKVLMIL